MNSEKRTPILNCQGERNSVAWKLLAAADGSDELVLALGCVVWF